MKTYIDDYVGISFPLGSAPSINWKHIDGPVLFFSDGQCHWLTLWERLLCALGLTDAGHIQARRRPKLAAMMAISLPRS